MTGRATWPWRALTTVGTWVLALWVLFEEWGWRPLMQVLARLARRPWVSRFERAIARLPAGGALLVFSVPVLLLLPVKLGAVWLVASGRWLSGVALLCAAKLVGTALVARLFLLTRPALMSMAWFARRYEAWSLWKASAFARVRRSRPWRLGRALKSRWRAMRRART